MFKFRFRRALPLFIAVSVGSVFMACHRPHPSWGEHCADTSGKAEKATKHLTRKLDLTSAQVVEVQNIIRSTLAEACQSAPERKAFGQALIADLRGTQADTAALGLKLNDLQSRFETMKSTLLSGYAKLHAVLTPEQRSKLAETMEKKMAD